MAQYIGYLLERAAVIKQPARQGMAKCMAAPVRQANASVGISNHTMHSIDADRLITGRHAPDENCRVRRRWPFMAKIVS